ncbi:MAG: hypothetical protein FJX34_00755 [Alphaproteobacteria bacterium]|nr:hypothetical protein [Alphaproteobacteria bacterium]
MKRQNSAFTIFQTALVLCLFAIMIGAIIAIQMIASSADVRAVIAQIGKYDQAIGAFSTKYQGLPGDVRNTIQQGISEENTDGDGNGIITNRDLGIAQASGEIVNFWRHLSATKMLDENYNGAENELAHFGKTFPVSKLGESAGIVAFGANGKNYFQIGFKFSNIDRLFTGNRSILAKDARLLDKKTDDADPLKGRVVAVGGDVLNYPPNNNCIKDGRYNKDRETPFCQLRIDMNK